MGIGATTTMRTYPAYKPSGVEWLGEVPAHWHIQKLKHVASLRSGEGITSESIQENGEYPVFGGNGLRGYTADYTHEGDYALIGRQGALCGNVNYADGRFWASEHAVVVTPLHPTAFFWLGELLRTMNLNQYSVSAAQPGLAVERIKELYIPLPPLPEQQAIAAFLDKKTQAIDAVIQRKERLIELLQEKRQALITHAVTKGLDPNVPLKDSGIPWLGEIPVHWTVKALKRVMSRVVVGIAEAATHAYAAEGVPIIRSTNVRPNSLAVDDLLYIEKWFAEKNRSKYLRGGDIVTVRTGNAGVSAVVPPELGVCQCFTLLISSPRKDQSAEFYCYFLNSHAGQTSFTLDGWGTAQTNISVPILQETLIAEPPIDEQQRIVAYLHSQSVQYETTIGCINEQVQKLREYRQTLISAAVTGKIDVRQEETA